MKTRDHTLFLRRVLLADAAASLATGLLMLLGAGMLGPLLGLPEALLHAVIELPGDSTPLHVVNVHLGLREAHRQRQVAQLAEFIAHDIPPASPLVVAGDFNDWRARAHPLLRAAGLREVFEDAQGRPALTFPALFPVFPLDRMYLRNVNALASSVLRTQPWSSLSDHAGLRVELET